MLGAVRGLVNGKMLRPTLPSKGWFLCRAGP
jgi:hypothetical protein